MRFKRCAWSSLWARTLLNGASAMAVGLHTSPPRAPSDVLMMPTCMSCTGGNSSVSPGGQAPDVDGPALAPAESRQFGLMRRLTRSGMAALR